MKTKVISTIGVLFAAGIITIAPLGEVKAEAKRGHFANAKGGTTAGSVIKRSGPNGGSVAAARYVRTDADGNAMGGSAFTANTANGGTAVRTGSFERNADGSASRHREVSASGTQGSVSSQGSISRSADGTVTAERNSSASNALSGNSVSTNATYQSGQGVNRTTTCFNAAGATVPCPTR